MDKDNDFLKELQVNDMVKVTVNFFGQEIPFEGTCTGITGDKLSILTSAKPDPVEFPLSAIKEGCITEKYSIPEQSSDDTEIIGSSFVENIKYDKNSYYGYIALIKDFEKQPKFNKTRNYRNDLIQQNDVYIPLSLIYLIPTPNYLSPNTVKILLDFLNICKSNVFLQTFFNNKIDKIINDAYTDKSIPKHIDRDTIIRDIDNNFIKKIIEAIDKSYHKEHVIISNNETKIIEVHSSEYNKEQIIKYLLLAISSLHHAEFLLMQLDSQTNDKHKNLALNEIKGHIDNIINNFTLFHSSLFCIKQYSTCVIGKECNYYSTTPETYKTLFRSGIYNNFRGLCRSFYFISEIISNKTILFKDNIYYHYSNFLLNTSIENDFFEPIIEDTEAYFFYIEGDNHVFPLTHKWSNNKRESLIRFFYQIYYHIDNVSDYSLFIKISDKKFETSFLSWIKNRYKLTNSTEKLISRLFDIFYNKYEELMLKIYTLCSITRIYNNDFSNIYNYINDVVVIIKNHGNNYLIINNRYLNTLSDFFTRIITIANKDSNASFNEAEKLLLKDINSFIYLTSPLDDEPISAEVHEYIRELNTWSHTKGFSESFYQQYIPSLEISIFSEAISINHDLHRIFVPFKIANSAKGQNAVIIKCATSSLNTNATELPILLLEILPGRHATMLAELSYNNLNEFFSGFDIEITLQYKFKIAWDFEKCEATWETREISESFCIQDELKNLANFHEIRNLFRDYSSGSVIKDDRMFFGRDQDIKHVIENIRDEAGRIVTNRCVCIYGQTRTGKSSLLYHIKKGLRASPSNIIVDIGDIGSAGASEAGIKYRILSCLLEEIEIEHDDICSLLTDSGISMTADPERNKTDDSYFNEQIGKIRSILKRKAKDTQIIILIDEFTYVYDWIKEKKLPKTFMKFWKAFITNYDICAIIVGQDHMMKFINDQRFTNAFGAIRTWEVNYLKEPDACKLVTMPVSDSPDYAGQNGCTILPEAVNLLVAMTSGSAYLLMNICANFIDYLNERHALIATGGHAEDFLRRNLSKFEERWFEPLFNDKSDLDSDESVTANKELLKKLALSYSEHSGVIEDDLSLSEAEKERLHNLEARRVVEMNDGRWRITVRLYAEWLRNKFGSR